MKRRMKRWAEKAPGWLFTLLTVALILWLTLAPEPVGDVDIPLFPGADKLVHAIMFGFLNLVVLFDLCRAHRWRYVATGWILLITLLAALFGVGIEYLQRAMGIGRSLEAADMLADSAGALLTGLSWWMAQRAARRQKQ